METTLRKLGHNKLQLDIIDLKAQIADLQQQILDSQITNNKNLTEITNLQDLLATTKDNSTKTKLELEEAYQQLEVSSKESFENLQKSHLVQNDHLKVHEKVAQDYQLLQKSFRSILADNDNLTVKFGDLKAKSKKTDQILTDTIKARSEDFSRILSLEAELQATKGSLQHIQALLEISQKENAILKKDIHERAQMMSTLFQESSPSKKLSSEEAIATIKKQEDLQNPSDATISSINPIVLPSRGIIPSRR
jgi:hypothetical protein